MADLLDNAPLAKTPLTSRFQRFGEHMPGLENYWFIKAEALLETAEAVVSDALRKAGWKHTCKTPGSFWMWEGEIDGRSYLLSRDDAARIQERRDREAYFEQYPHELND